MAEVVSLAKRRGFVYPTSEIYGGLISSYDYGPIGSMLLHNLRRLWWQTFVETRPDMVGLDSQIILHPLTWHASGHVENFNDPLVEDKINNKRYRADHLIESWQESHPQVDQTRAENMTFDQMNNFIEDFSVTSPEGHPLSPIKSFNQLFTTRIGAVEESSSTVYLRGETAQGIFSNFKNVVDTTRVKLPFGVGQIGKSFRNEITTGQFVFRTLEFEQAEIEYFFNPHRSDWHQLMDTWKSDMWNFLTKDLGLNPSNLRWRRHSDSERSHYSLDTYDLDYNFPFGFKELWGIAYRTDYDLTQHSRHSQADLTYLDSDTNEKIIPHVIEPAVGINRLFLAVLSDCFNQNTDRTYLSLKPQLAPYKLAVFPLVRNKPELTSKATQIFNHARLDLKLSTTFDDRGNIGKRYYAQDEIGTPWCVTVDYQTLEDDTVTIRDRDTMVQTRIHVSQLDSYIAAGLK